MLVGVFAASAVPIDYKSKKIQGGEAVNIDVHKDHFLLIRNFTQQDGTTRGTVKVNDVVALTASIVDPDDTSKLEVINSIVIAGPKVVLATCPSDATCFISYRNSPNPE